jgi:hypothetical protein
MVTSTPSAYPGSPTHLEALMEPAFRHTYLSPLVLSSTHIPYQSMTYLHPFRFPLLLVTFLIHLVVVLLGWAVVPEPELE